MMICSCFFQLHLCASAILRGFYDLPDPLWRDLLPRQPRPGWTLFLPSRQRNQRDAEEFAELHAAVFRQRFLGSDRSEKVVSCFLWLPQRDFCRFFLGGVGSEYGGEVILVFLCILGVFGVFLMGRF